MRMVTADEPESTHSESCEREKKIISVHNAFHMANNLSKSASSDDHHHHHRHHRHVYAQSNPTLKSTQRKEIHRCGEENEKQGKVIPKSHIKNDEPSGEYSSDNDFPILFSFVFVAFFSLSPFQCFFFFFPILRIRQRWLQRSVVSSGNYIRNTHTQKCFVFFFLL